ncbi:hypothetical protein [Kosakonia radicincitans]|uniref:hypothetical protein n=2 Tax=Kosakonia radicincitans TaxID=283686 RepID=UPI001D067C0B|nr:hypothetical protein [Kosakonia radicincitans]
MGFYTLSKKDDEFILKVMFTEGDYKVDVARFFLFSFDEIVKPLDVDYVKSISENIRANYNSFQSRELRKKEFDDLV